MAAAAFSCCGIERTRTEGDDEREEEGANDEIVIADGDDDAKPGRSPGEGTEARRRGVGADELHAQAGPREEARECDAVIIGEASATGGKKDWIREWEEKGGGEKNSEAKKKKCRVDRPFFTLFRRSSYKNSSPSSVFDAHSSPPHRPCWPQRRAWPACSRAASRGDAAARRRPLLPRRRWPLLCHDDTESTISVVASMSLPALLLLPPPLRPSPLTRRPRPLSPRPRR